MKLTITCFLVAAFLLSFAVDTSIVEQRAAGSSKPLVVYFSGDGGWNRFSTSLIQGLHQHGFEVLGLNSRWWFWKKQSADEKAKRIASLVSAYMKQWQHQEVILIGYSYGADVLPFIQARFPDSLSASIKNTLLLSPSGNANMQITLLNLLGYYSNTGADVLTEITRLKTPVSIFMGRDEKDIPIDKLRDKNISVIWMEGGHHYHYDTGLLVEKMTEEMNRSVAHI